MICKLDILILIVIGLAGLWCFFAGFMRNVIALAAVTAGIFIASRYWKYLAPSSRRPKKRRDENGQVIEEQSSKPAKTQKTLEAIEKFVNIQLLIVGTLQLMGKGFCREIKKKSRCYLRTESTLVPSEFVTRSALKNILRPFLYGLGNSWIMHLIQKRQNNGRNKGYCKKTG